MGFETKKIILELLRGSEVLKKTLHSWSERPGRPRLPNVLLGIILNGLRYNYFFNSQNLQKIS